MPHFFGEVAFTNGGAPVSNLQATATNALIYGIGTTTLLTHEKVRLWQITIENRPRSSILAPLATTVEFGTYFGSNDFTQVSNVYAYDKQNAPTLHRPNVRISHYQGSIHEDVAMSASLGKAQLAAVPGASHTMEFWDNPFLCYRNGFDFMFGIWNRGSSACRFMVHAIFSI